MMELEKKLEEFYDSASAEQLDLFDVYPEERLEASVRDMIFSSAARKAGIEMKDQRKAKGRIFGKRIAAFAAAAAVLAVGFAGTAAAVEAGLIPREYCFWMDIPEEERYEPEVLTDIYLGEGTYETIEELGIEPRLLQYSDEHYNITASPVLSDGLQMITMIDIEALDGGLTGVHGTDYYIDTDFQYTDTNEYLSGIRASSSYRSELINESHFVEDLYLNIADVDISREIKMVINKRIVDGEKEDVQKIGEIILDLSPNVYSAALVNSEGEELEFSSIGIGGLYETGIPEAIREFHSDFVTVRPVPRLILIDYNGDKYEYDIHSIGSDDNSAYITYGYGRSVVDITQFKGVEIAGTEFLKQE